MKMHNIKSIAKRVVQIERDTLTELANTFDDTFVEVVHMIHNFNHRLIICGIGKSALIAQKITATLNSTGTPAMFLHAADAIHGDSGMIRSGDIVMILSKSGETPEIIALTSLVKSYGNTIVAMVSQLQSSLAKYADHVLYIPVKQEADPNQLAPTSSSIAQQAMGDALAICLLELRGFSKEEFAKYHPGGSLGKRLFLTVQDIIQDNGSPMVSMDDSITDVILQISEHRLGAAIVVSSENTVVGIITDGDLRRMIQNSQEWVKSKAKDIMTSAPKTIEADAMAVEALALAQMHNITQIPVVDAGKYIGMIHLHDLISAGII